MSEVVEALHLWVGEEASGLVGARVEQTGALMGLRRGSLVFATLEGGALDVRLGPDIVAAALRTPDTSPSARGTDWLRFAPRAADRMAEDRVRAWVVAAWRLAGR